MVNRHFTVRARKDSTQWCRQCVPLAVKWTWSTRMDRHPCISQLGWDTQRSSAVSSSLGHSQNFQIRYVKQTWLPDVPWVPPRDGYWGYKNWHYYYIIIKWYMTGRSNLSLQAFTGLRASIHHFVTTSRSTIWTLLNRQLKKEAHITAHQLSNIHLQGMIWCRGTYSKMLAYDSNCQGPVLSDFVLG